jgi:5'-nucleotidase
MPPSILLTNDDGIQSPALDILEKVLTPLGSISVVAPDREMSACSHSLTFNQPLRFHQWSKNRYAVQGTPADCVILAALKILKEKPDLVISGINRGANVGDDIAYSGTIGGALEGSLQGIPSIAISNFARSNPDYGPAADVTARLAAKVLKDGLPPGVVLNVNFPELWNGELKLTCQGRRSGRTVLVENLDPRGREYFWLHEELHKTQERRPNAPELMSDYEALSAGYVSITPIQLDRTAYAFADRMSSWLATDA